MQSNTIKKEIFAIRNKMAKIPASKTEHNVNNE